MRLRAAHGFCALPRRQAPIAEQAHLTAGAKARFLRVVVLLPAGLQPR